MGVPAVIGRRALANVLRKESSCQCTRGRLPTHQTQEPAGATGISSSRGGGRRGGWRLGDGEAHVCRVRLRSGELDRDRRGGGDRDRARGAKAGSWSNLQSLLVQFPSKSGIGASMELFGRNSAAGKGHVCAAPDIQKPKLGRKLGVLCTFRGPGRPHTGRRRCQTSRFRSNPCSPEANECITNRLLSVLLRFLGHFPALATRGQANE